MSKPETAAPTIKVIGHRHPDTDSVCAAIAYSRLKSRLDPEHVYEPCRAGILSRETQFALNYFHVPDPSLYMDVSPQIKDSGYRKMPGVRASMSLRQAWRTMREHNVDTLCVVDEEEKLSGVITVRDMATASMELIDEMILAKARTSYRNLQETLSAKVVIGDLTDRTVEGRIIVGAGSSEMIENVVSKGDVVLVSNRFSSQRAAVEMGAGCVIVCTGAAVSSDICKLAIAQRCVILSTPLDTYAAGQMIVQSVPIRHYMVTENLLTFTPDSPAEQVTRVMAAVRYRYFPILDSEGRYLGVISRRNMMERQRKQLILVDHNEKSQAVDGIDTAEILEIIDHHRLSALGSDVPIRFRNEPVGCTCTIIYQMFREQGVDIDPSTAGILLSAILSDTLMFRSPTCTAEDEAAARALAPLAGVELEQYADAMFEAGSDITGKTPNDILNTDFKIFGDQKVRFGISQNNFMTEKSRAASEELVLPYLRGFMERQGLDCLFCMFTHVPTSATEVLMAGKGAEDLIRSAFHAEVIDGRALLPGVVSRKKQMVPALLEALRQTGS